MSKESISLDNYVLAGYPAIYLRTTDEQRALRECLRVQKILSDKNEIKLMCWSEVSGIYNPLEFSANRDKTEKIVFNPFEDEYYRIFEKGLNYEAGTICCILDFQHYIKHPRTIRAAKEAFQMAKERVITFVFISESLDIPSDLKHEIITYDMPLPSTKELEALVREIVKNNNIKISAEEIKKAAEALSGLNESEADNAIAISLLNGNLNLDVIYDIKKRIICQDHLLEYYKSDETIENVGGLEVLKEYLKQRSFSGFTAEAREYGLPYPKGVLLFGIPGCGKSLAAKALANMWQVPLVKFDLSNLFGSLVGETEKNTRQALKTAEAMAPCIVWMDEIDKALSGTQSSGRTDSGVTARLFGTILTWLQEKEAPVYVIATANSIELPPEFLRKGRFDEIFFVDLPNQEERKDIIIVQIKKHKRNPEDFDIDLLTEKSDGYNGAEIENAIESAMIKAWNDGKRPYTTEDIESSMKEFSPASAGIMKETVANLRKWAQDHNIRNANGICYKEATQLSSKRIRRTKKTADN